MNNTQKSRKSRLLLKLAQAGILSVALMGAIIGLSPAHKAEAAANNNSLNSMIHQVFGSYGDQAVRVAQCESTMNPGATNSYAIAGSHAAGLFQILHPSTWFTTAEGRAGHSPYDAAANIRAAHEIFVRDGYSWREWQCKP
ncbi:MAG: hypothetical protein J2P37_18205 [Ktedonobacteraceae bacterium]|nr:hypothetical protein [Ktedonobacteraceae bacterium]MBO0796573.1 hypothetical protein [Ktedonobacteraceae bacterium]